MPELSFMTNLLEMIAALAALGVTFILYREARNRHREYRDIKRETKELRDEVNSLRDKE